VPRFVEMFNLCADRSILALPSAYQECPVAFKLMTSRQVVQRARLFTGHIWLLKRQRVKVTVYTFGGACIWSNLKSRFRFSQETQDF